MLEASEARYRELFENMKSGVIVYVALDGADDFEILEMNAASEKIERLKRSDVVGLRATSVSPCINACGLLEMLREVWKNNESGYFPEVHCRCGETEHWKDFFIYKLPSGEVVAVYDDVSDRKLADNLLSSYRDELEKQVHERTLELVEANRRLNLEVSERKKKARELRGAADRLRILSDHLQRVREQERRRIALEVHDNLGQELTVMKMNLSPLARKVGGDEEAEMKVRELSHGIDRTIRAVREIASELRPAVLDYLGLDAALEWQLNSFCEKFGIETAFSADADPGLIDPDLGIALFRIAQEALTNVARHAGATRVKVELSISSDGLLLSISDNGRGIMESEVTATRSVGIMSMNERANAFGGQVVISGSPGKGTSVTVRIPHAATRESPITLDRLNE